MLRIDTPASEYLERTAGIVPASSDYTVIFFYRPNVTPTSTNYLTLYYCGDDPAIDYIEYVGIFTDDTDSDKLKLYVSDGVTTEISIGSAFDLQQFRCVAYVRSGDQHKFYINGVLIDTLTLDISSCNFTNFLLGSDKFGAASNHDFFQCREWSRALTVDEIQAEFRSTTAIDDVDLQTDYPLFSDGDDDSGNFYDLTEVGTVEWLGQPPNNLTAFSSTVIAVPSTNNYNANRSDNFETFIVWFELVAPAARKMIGAFAYNNVGTYKPRLFPYFSNATSQVLNIGSTNKPIQFPVVALDKYFLRNIPNTQASTADFSLNVLAHLPAAVPIGSIAVNDDSNGFPLAVLNRTVDYNVLDFFLDFPAGEAADTAANGNVLVADFSDNSVKLFDRDYNQLASLSGKNTVVIRTCRGKNTFFVASDSSPVVAWEISDEGVELDTWTLTGVNRCQGIAANNDGTILYTSVGSVPSAIRRWDLVNNIALSNLCAADGSYIVWDILYLEDDTIIASYVINGGNVKVKHIDPSDGSTINEFDFGSNFDFPSGTFPRLAYAIQSPESFWIWLHPDAVIGVSSFRRIQVSDGAVLESHSGVEYELGSYQGVETSSPIARFGHSYSCPFWIVREGEVPPVDTPTGIFKLTPGATDDEYNGLQRVRIPTPFYKTYFHGE